MSAGPPPWARYVAAPMIASRGIVGSPPQHCAQVDGRNCIGPTAPADDVPTIRPMRVSWKWMAASQYHGIPVPASASR